MQGTVVLNTDLMNKRKCVCAPTFIQKLSSSKESNFYQLNLTLSAIGEERILQEMYILIGNKIKQEFCVKSIYPMNNLLYSSVWTVLDFLRVTSPAIDK